MSATDISATCAKCGYSTPVVMGGSLENMSINVIIPPEGRCQNQPLEVPEDFDCPELRRAVWAALAQYRQ